MNETQQTTLGELISLFYAQYLEQYGDEDLASVATAATINQMLIDAAPAAVVDPPSRQAA